MFDGPKPKTDQPSPNATVQEIGMAINNALGRIEEKLHTRLKAELSDFDNHLQFNKVSVESELNARIDKAGAKLEDLSKRVLVTHDSTDDKFLSTDRDTLKTDYQIWCAQFPPRTNHSRRLLAASRSVNPTEIAELSSKMQNIKKQIDDLRQDRLNNGSVPNGAYFVWMCNSRNESNPCIELMQFVEQRK
jgi:hypothetical protein